MSRKALLGLSRCLRHCSAVIFIALTAVFYTVSAQAATTLYPKDITMARGQVSSQGVSVLSKDTQSGSSDNWYAYLEFYPAKTGMISIMKFDFRGVRNPGNAVLRVNFRGPEHYEQRYLWDIHDFVRQRWITIGNNASASSWVWTHQNFSIPAPFSNFIGPSGRVLVRYATLSAFDASNLDAVSITLGSGSTSASQNSTPTQPAPPSQTRNGIWSPPPGTSWQWQLQGGINTSFNVDMYNIDLFETPTSVIRALQNRGAAVICYMSAGSWEDWRPDERRFPAATLGNSNGWPGERWLDIRNINALAPVMTARMDLAVQKGCTGIEPDNIDGYTNNTGFPLRASDQLNYNIWLAEQAHARGLSIGLKNDLDQVRQLEPYFDWALNEQCVQYNECEKLLPFIQAGKAVFGVEYTGSSSRICQYTNGLNFDWMIKNMDLDAYRLSCR